MTDSNKTRYTEFDALVERHQGLIRSLCWRDAGGDAGVCADLMQEVLMQLWRQRHRLRAGVSRGEEREWVRLQTRNVLQHHRRHPLPPVVSLDEAAQVAVDAVDHRAELEALAAGLSEQENYEFIEPTNNVFCGSGRVLSFSDFEHFFFGFVK